MWTSSFQRFSQKEKVTWESYPSRLVRQSGSKTHEKIQLSTWFNMSGQIINSIRYIKVVKHKQKTEVISQVLSQRNKAVFAIVNNWNNNYNINFWNKKEIDLNENRKDNKAIASCSLVIAERPALEALKVDGFYPTLQVLPSFLSLPGTTTSGSATSGTFVPSY